MLLIQNEYSEGNFLLVLKDAEDYMCTDIDNCVKNSEVLLLKIWVLDPLLPGGHRGLPEFDSIEIYQSNI